MDRLRELKVKYTWEKWSTLSIKVELLNYADNFFTEMGSCNARLDGWFSLLIL